MSSRYYNSQNAGKIKIFKHRATIIKIVVFKTLQFPKIQKKKHKW